jgi:hypothetical protein
VACCALEMTLLGRAIATDLANAEAHAHMAFTHVLDYANA